MTLSVGSYHEYMLNQIGFDPRWFSWMIVVCISGSSMSVLVNESPARSLTHSLTPFFFILILLFLVVVEGLAGIMNKAVEVGILNGYKVNLRLFLALLQFADDTFDL